SIRIVLAQLVDLLVRDDTAVLREWPDPVQRLGLARASCRRRGEGAACQLGDHRAGGLLFAPGQLFGGSEHVLVNVQCGAHASVARASTARRQAALVSPPGRFGPLSGRRDDVDPDEVEVTSARQHVPVVRVYLPVAVLARRNEVNGVACTEERLPAQRADPVTRTPQQGRGHEDPVPTPRCLVFLELAEHLARLAGAQVSLPKMALHDADELEPSPLTRGEPVGPAGEPPDAVGSRLVQVALRDICRVEVDHPRARISDWYRAESTRMRDRFRIFSSRSGSGLAITPGLNGWSAATWRPRSVTMTGSPVVAACRTHRPVARCSSRIVIVFMCTLWHEQRARARFSRSPAELEAGVGGRRSARRDRGLCLADGGQLGLEPLELALEGRARLLGA